MDTAGCRRRRAQHLDVVSNLSPATRPTAACVLAAASLVWSGHSARAAMDMAGLSVYEPSRFRVEVESELQQHGVFFWPWRRTCGLV
jgi:hypothetical protein